MSYERFEHSGNAIPATLAGSITSSDSEVALVDATGWPTGGTGPFYFEIDPSTATYEKCIATSRTGNTLDGVTRGADGTTAVAHEPSTAAVLHIFSATEADEANQAVHAVLGSGQIDALPLQLASGAPVYQALMPAGLASNSVTTPKIVDNAVTTAKIIDGAVTLSKLSQRHRQIFSVTSAGSGRVTIPHGASFTPTWAQIMFTAPEAGSSDFITGWVIDQSNPIDATNVYIVAAWLHSGSVSALPNSQGVAGTILVEA